MKLEAGPVLWTAVDGEFAPDEPGDLLGSAACLLETIALHGIQPTYEDGSDTPNRKLCLLRAKQLREYYVLHKEFNPGASVEAGSLAQLKASHAANTIVTSVNILEMLAHLGLDPADAQLILECRLRAIDLREVRDDMAKREPHGQTSLPPAGRTYQDDLYRLHQILKEEGVVVAAKRSQVGKAYRRWMVAFGLAILSISYLSITYMGFDLAVAALSFAVITGSIIWRDCRRMDARVAILDGDLGQEVTSRVFKLDFPNKTKLQRKVLSTGHLSFAVLEQAVHDIDRGLSTQARRQELMTLINYVESEDPQVAEK